MKKKMPTASDTTLASSSKSQQQVAVMAQILKRVSEKTLGMKADQIKLFNRINNEMNTLLSKAQEIIRICLSDRNGNLNFPQTIIKNCSTNSRTVLDFITQAESLQTDYAELKRMLEDHQDKDTSV